MTQGHQLFADGLTRLAAEVSEPRLTAIAAGVDAPLRVAVHGRRGVGRRTVAAALAAAGVRIAGDDAVGDKDADITVRVVAEVVKPEDIAAVRATRPRPVLVLLNKADLSGHCDIADVVAATRAPAEPMSALFALAALDGRLDDGLWAACRLLAEQPADLRSAERFVSGPHRVPRPVRERLCAVLDVSGIVRVLEPARRGATAGAASALLRRHSGVEAVLARLAVLGAELRHRRIAEAAARLAALAVGRDSAGRIDEFLVRDSTVAARMAAAAAVVGPPDEPALSRARRWQAHRDAPVDAARRACAADIARGSLRAWATTRGQP